MVSATVKKEMDMEQHRRLKQKPDELYPERFRIALLSAKTYPGGDCYSGHDSVIAKF